MAETVHLFLKANGQDIPGEPTQVSLDRADSIECVFFEQGVETAREAGSGVATGRRKYGPVTIRKRIDKATPLLFKALCNNENIEGTFKFYRPSPTGDGTTQQYYTVDIKDARVGSVRDYSPDVIDPISSNYPAMEEVSFIFGNITWTYEDGGITHTDSWKEGF